LACDRFEIHGPHDGRLRNRGTVNIFIVTGGDRHPTELADFCGARLVIVGETGKDDSFDEAKLKKLTGRDPIRARFMREDFFEFEATHKLAFAGNFLPKLRSADHAMRRRTRICPFDFPHKRVDKTRAAALKREGGGVLKLLVAAAVTWETEKLTEPAVIKAATDRYFETANPMRRWLRERCQLGRRLEEKSGTLYSDYVRWARETDETPSASVASLRSLMA
jgi:putative DNA primase/helicase